MHFVVVHKLADASGNTSNSMLELAFSCKPLRDIVFERLTGWSDFQKDGFLIAVPDEWKHDGSSSDFKVLRYRDKAVAPQIRSSRGKKSWFVVSNGRFLTWEDKRLLYNAVAQAGSDVVAVNIDPNLRAGCEKVRADSQGNLFGFRLLYMDTVIAALLPCDWPHHLFVSSALVDRLFTDRAIPLDFSEFTGRCRSNSSTITALNIGGTVLDLNTEKGLLSLLRIKPAKKRPHCNGIPNGNTISQSARLLGRVALGRDVKIGENALVAGPSIICDGARLADNAVIHGSIIGPGVTLPSGTVVLNRVMLGYDELSRQNGCNPDIPLSAGCLDVPAKGFYRGPFRVWPGFSYARCLKRIVDVIVALFVLLIFAPVLPVIALAVKLSSKGPVFFKDIRQGLHGRPFACVKFRTMQQGADRLQEELRMLNEADGPQFVIADDPRMSKVGRFLRETYIDEIPQFFAVLTGRMSVVGPRPSPESENVLCPFWRDARLSVRPGITGFWQVCRTRQPMKDFQEWIHYDIEYVRNLSLGLDLWICWKTFMKMVKNFVRQF